MSQIDRRSVLSRAVLLSVSTACTLAMTACADDPASPRPEPAPETGPEGTSPPRTVIVYFSRPGENYWYGDRKDLEVGNTQVVAESIAELIDADIFQIGAAEPYPHDYDETVERNREEQQTDARPEIASGVPDLSEYDSIILGCPVWNTRIPTIVRTLLDGADLTGKTIYPFVTFAIAEGRVFNDYAELYPAATIKVGLAVQGEEAADAGTQIAAWVAELGLASR
ncbi:flavodoxin [Arthrobacter sp. NPDC093128]|uniref:flavodoxin n=1 Tax=Arthrobacter sp. NPDC093128 TaxID=3154979 RepID=UPI0034344F56